jgi:hypothetical protein
MDPYLGMKIVNRRRKEAENEAAAYRLWRDSDTIGEGWVARASHSVASRTAGWLLAAGKWLDDLSAAGRLPPLDGQMRPSG